ncbi:S-layer homology domain-containing protein [Paenibacillus thailandensis]|uniref:S-layer homology domain-containing protein n=1 Tax=Paenibacillus thailandensis TaxID=393250 RepID=A0ABW5QWU8_9BACL
MASTSMRKYAAAALAALACFPVMAHASFAAVTKPPYTDISSSYAKAEIIELYERDLMKGTTETTFSPKKAITRAEFVTVLNRLLGLKPVDAAVTPFRDTQSAAWYYEAVMAAFQLGLVQGKSETSFAPSASITRQEAAVLLVRALKQETDASANEMAGVSDKASISAWAEEAVAKAFELNLLKGDSGGKFRPNDPITREEAATIVARIVSNEDWADELEQKPDYGIQLGWQYGQTTAEFEKSVAASTVNTLSPRWYFLEEGGKLTDHTDKSLIQWASAKGKQVWAMVGNRSDQDLTHEVLSDAAAREALVGNLASMVSKYGLDGLNIDFENVAPKDRASMTAFVKSLSSALREEGAVLSFNVSPDRGTDWTEAFDYAAIGQAADYVVLMCYDEHWGGSSTAGSVSSLSYVKSSLATLAQAVAPDKIVLAMPYYTRDWTLKADGSAASSVSITLQNQQTLIQTNNAAISWDDQAGQYIATYTKGGYKHRIWAEDGRSIGRKLEAAASYGLAGYAYWYIGAETPDIWDSIRNSSVFLQYDFE